MCFFANCCESPERAFRKNPQFLTKFALVKYCEYRVIIVLKPQISCGLQKKYRSGVSLTVTLTTPLSDRRPDYPNPNPTTPTSLTLTPDNACDKDRDAQNCDVRTVLHYCCNIFCHCWRKDPVKAGKI